METEHDEVKRIIDGEIAVDKHSPSSGIEFDVRFNHERGQSGVIKYSGSLKENGQPYCVANDTDDNGLDENVAWFDDLQNALDELQARLDANTLDDAQTRLK